MAVFFFMGFTDRNNQANLNQRGNEMFLGEDLESALNYYKRALESGSEEARPNIHMNIGNTYYRMGKYDKALSEYLLAKSITDDESLRADAFFNIGNSYFASQDYEKAVQAYIEALKIDPSDADSKYNFELSLKMLQDDQEQDEEDQESEDREDDQESEESDEEQDQDDTEDQEQDQDETEDQEQDQTQEQDEESPDDEEEISLDRSQMERLLDMMDDEDKAAQEERVRSAIIKEIPEGLADVEKDW